MSDFGLVLFYARPNRFSFHALIGALEADAAFDDLDIVLARKPDDLVPHAATAIRKYGRAVLAFSVMTAHVPRIRRMLPLLKAKLGPAAVLVAGGPHAAADPNGMLELGFDFIVCGEGEESFPGLLKAIGGACDIGGVRGIAYRENGAVRSTGRAGVVDLDRYPPFAVRHRRSGPIEITRGCPFVCGFCQVSALFGTRPRHRSVAAIVKYVEVLRENGLWDVRFISPNAFSYGSPDGKQLNLPALRELLSASRETIGERGRVYFGSFPSEVRPEHVTPETVALVREFCDNDNVIVGAQSGSECMLDLCGRGHTVDDVFRAVDVIAGAGLTANIDFIFGLPGETADDVDATLRVVEALLANGARIHAHRFTPLPQTRFSGAAPGRLSAKTLSLFGRLAATGAVYGEWREWGEEV